MPTVYCDAGEVVDKGMALVIWGESGTLGTSFDLRWSAAERAIWVIVGLILSDCSLQIRGRVNARLKFEQSTKHFPYFLHTFWICSPLCQSRFKFQTIYRKGTVCYSVEFYTRCLPFLTYLYNLFYVNGVKCIPNVVIMFDLLTPIALANWIIGDGVWNDYGLILCTESFSIADNVKLINILMVRYQLDCPLRSSDNRIYIRADLCRVYVLLSFLLCTILYFISLVYNKR